MIQAFLFAFAVECTAVAFAYFVGGVGPAAAALVAGPLILAPISRQVALKLERQPKGGEQALERPSFLTALIISLAAVVLGVVGTDVVGHPTFGWRYIVVVVSAVLWLIVVTVVMRRKPPP